MSVCYLFATPLRANDLPQSQAYYGEDLSQTPIRACSPGLLSASAAESSSLLQKLNRIHWSHHVAREGYYDEILEIKPGFSDAYVIRRHPSYKRIRQMMYGLRQHPETREWIRGFDLLHGEELCEIRPDLDCNETYALSVFYRTNDEAGVDHFTNHETASGWPRQPMIPSIEDGVNTEHVWPKSRMVKREKYPQAWQQADPHILRAAHPLHNAIRSNLHYAEVETNTNDKIFYKGNKRGPPVVVEGILPSRPEYYEPPEVFRGEIARAVFYFATIYEADIDPLEEYFLRKWHEEYPVTERERIRNQLIYEELGTRNPFVDHPELVDRIPVFRW